MSKREVQTAYQRYAKRYNFTTQLYRLMGFRLDAYRRRALELLDPKPGECIVELGCGTGLNFAFIMERIGPEGRLIGVDMTPEMLAVARERCDSRGWNNVELVQSDIAAFAFPEMVNGVVTTGVLGYVTESDRVIEKGAGALAPGGRLVIFDIKRSDAWPSWLFNIFVWLAAPFAVTLEYFVDRPWESVEKYFDDATYEESYLGLVYHASGTAPSAKSNREESSHS